MGSPVDVFSRNAGFYCNLQAIEQGNDAGEREGTAWIPKVNLRRLFPFSLLKSGSDRKSQQRIKK
jgi:hypothetical protein